MSNIAVRNANCALSYIYKGVTSTAKVRCSAINTQWQVNSEESHARQSRAFYPHLRTQGTFTLTIDCKGWAEQNALMTWFRSYATSVLASGTSTDQPVPPPMTVTIAPANSQADSMPGFTFQRSAFPTTGVVFGDHVGSMVFSPQITFISVADPTDPNASILKTNQTSQVNTSNVRDPAVTTWYYPGSTNNNPGALETYLYDQAVNLFVQGLQDLVTALTPAPTPQQSALTQKLNRLGG